MSQHKDKKTGKWYFTGRYKDLLGATHFYKKRGFQSKPVAKKAEEVFLARMSQSVVRVTFDTLVAVYADEYELYNVKESTFIGDESYYNTHLKEVFGGKFVDDISANDIERWKAHMIRKPKIDKQGNEKGRYAEQTINHAKNVLSKYLSYAVAKGYIKYNPARNVKKYRNTEAIKRRSEEEENFWEPNEFKSFIEHVSEPYWRIVFEFLYGTGIREGELFALTWGAIDFSGNKIHIDQSITSKTKAKGIRITTPKNSNSWRSIDMQTHIKDILLSRYEQAAKLDGYNKDFYVFGDIIPLSRSTLARKLDKYIALAEVKRITPHGFRHSHATVLINAKIDDSLIAERLGHTVAELRKTYAHVYKNQRINLVSALDKVYNT